MNTTVQLATFAGGCFWCTEAIFKELKGVTKVISGYAGGTIPNPTYKMLHAMKTGYAEAIQVEFDPAIISYEQLIEVFFLTHDPTTLNRQGNDVGEEYRSVIFYHNDDQKKIAEQLKSRIEQEKIYDKPIITEIQPYMQLYPAEDYHQDFYAKNPEQSYCQVIINPKVAKFRKKFTGLLKESE